MTGSPAWMFGAWILGGAVSIVGALCYAELATAWPHAGGDYHFLRRAFGANTTKATPATPSNAHGCAPTLS